MLTLTRDLKENKPFSLTKKVFSHYDRVCVRCNRDTEKCECYPLTDKECRTRGGLQAHSLKIKGTWRYFKTPHIFGEAAERRRYKTITFKEEDPEVTEKAIRSYFAFVAEEIQNRLIRL